MPDPKSKFEYQWKMAGARAMDIAHRVLEFIESSQRILQLCDVIWEEYPAATRLADASQYVANRFADIFLVYTRLMRIMRGVPELHNAPDNVLEHHLNVLFILYSRRMIEWNDRFRRERYQLGRQWDLVGDFIQNHTQQLIRNLELYHATTGQYIPLGRRDQMALSRAVGPARVEQVAPQTWLFLTAEERLHAGIEAVPRLLTGHQRDQELEQMLQREREAGVGGAGDRDPQVLGVENRLRRALPVYGAQTQPNGRTGSEDFDCSVCLNPYQPSEGAQYFRTRCNHRFCIDCIRQWVDIQRHRTCPMCRGPI